MAVRFSGATRNLNTRTTWVNDILRRLVALYANVDEELSRPLPDRRHRRWLAALLTFWQSGLEQYR